MRIGSIFVVIIMMLSLAGCAISRGEMLPNSINTTVDLSQGNYRIVKANAIGVSKGIKILGLIPLSLPKHSIAMEDLVLDAGIEEGKAQALINVTEERTDVFLGLFSIPKLRIRADVVEFTD